MYSLTEATHQIMVKVFMAPNNEINTCMYFKLLYLLAEKKFSNGLLMGYAHHLFLLCLF